MERTAVRFRVQDEQPKRTGIDRVVPIRRRACVETRPVLFAEFLDRFGAVEVDEGGGVPL